MSESPNLVGDWINQNGSCLRISTIEDGVVKGTFESKKGRAAGKQYQVIGVQNGEVLAFIVNFKDEEENLQAMTCFSGRCVRNKRNGEDQIHTLWVLTRQFEDEARTKPTQAWNSFLTNSDLFTRMSQSV